MNTIKSYPNSVRSIENEWIPLSDGCRLAARVWMPEDAESHPVPAILEYIPYRKRDAYRSNDEIIHPYFAGHGYACLRVDLRGSGDSEGLLLDEYLSQELDDAVEVINWVANQPWCTGKVGMMGISWGGFNSLQVASLRPPALKAIITSCSTDDRYSDDVHYMGGCMLVDNFSWAATMFGRMSTPPDPAIVGERWRDMWLERLEALPLFIETWFKHQRRDAYWKHGSVCEDYAAIQCPVFAIGGWADAYTNAIPHLLEGLKVPRIGIIGPWSHYFGHEGAPGPKIGFLQEALRWWGYWLKGIETGIMDEPMLRAWMQQSVIPKPYYEERPGRWIAVPSWPPKDGIRMRCFVLDTRGLVEGSGSETPLIVCSPQDTGTAGGSWCPYTDGTDLPADQRLDDAGSLIFDSLALKERVEVLGFPSITLDLSSNKPNAMVAIRLNDVAPDGSSLRVSYGLLNLSHLNSHEEASPLVPGKRYRVVVKLGFTSHSFAAGHRIRLAVSNCYWPIAWPMPETTTLTLYTGASFAELPELAPLTQDRMITFPPTEHAPPMPHRVIDPGRNERWIRRNIGKQETEVFIVSNPGLIHINEIDLDYGAWRREIHRIKADDPLSARSEVTYSFLFRREDWEIRIKTCTRLSLTREHFIIHADVDAFENGNRIYARSEERHIPRDT